MFLPVSAGILATMVEEAVVVVGVLQRQDRCADKGVDGLEMRLQLGREIKIHAGGGFGMVNDHSIPLGNPRLLFLQEFFLSPHSDLGANMDVGPSFR